MSTFLYFYILLYFSIKKINCGNMTCFEYSCDECESQEYGSCTKCREGFRLINGTCPCQKVNCALCDTGLAGLHICSLCKNGYYNYNDDCYCDIEDCEFCSEKLCLICKAGYYFNTISNTCEKQKDEEKLPCYDQNCDGCFSEEKGGCDYCKEGYFYQKGECLDLPKPDNNKKCPDGHYLKDDKYCDKICGGVDCHEKQFYYNLCPINKCLVCSDNELQIFSECDNSQNCTMEGCLNCITNDECLICTQGYFLLYGICIKCPEGCSVCINNETCILCLSGFKFNSEKKCVLSNNFDFNINKYKKYKNKLIETNFPEEKKYIKDDISDKDIVECDKNCIKCYDNTGVCKECDKLYILENNTCIKHCSDDNCLDCSLFRETEQCNLCKEGYILKNKQCYYNCSDPHCSSCALENNTEICYKCAINYKLDKNNKNCKSDTNFFVVIFFIIGGLIILIAILSFCIYRKKKLDNKRILMNMASLDQSSQTNRVNVYGRNNELDNSGRIELNKEQIAEEYENQKKKKEKDYPMCQFCKKKPGKFKSDCGCLVCKEHSILKDMVKNGENCKVCLVCEKIVKKVNPVKYDCHICLQKKISVAHFKCECALEVCKDCFIKCKMGSGTCPQCRASI